MYIKLVKIITHIFCFTVFFHQILGLQILNNNTEENAVAKLRLIYVTNECTTLSKDVGFCVQAQNCDLNYSELTKSDIPNISCGPRNQNRKRPFVCCDLNRLIQDNTTDNSPQSTTLNPEIIVEDSSPKLGTEMCGMQIPELVTRIVGGQDAVPGEFPWMARLMRTNARNESYFSCTGALISSTVVLTTAHCIVSSQLIQLGQLNTVNLGEHETECKFGQKDCLQNQKTYKIAKLITHPKYIPTSKDHKNDIGLIKLAEKVEFTPSISPICLLEEPFEAESYAVSGWGRTESGVVSTTKLKTTVMLFPWQECVNKYKTVNVTVTKKQICAGGSKGRDTCQGDSGGPLMLLKNETRWFVAGVVSFGVGCGREGWPAVYASVPSYIAWIKREMRKAGA